MTLMIESPLGTEELSAPSIHRRVTTDRPPGPPPANFPMLVSMSKAHANLAGIRSRDFARDSRFHKNRNRRSVGNRESRVPEMRARRRRSSGGGLYSSRKRRLFSTAATTAAMTESAINSTPRMRRFARP